MEFAVVGFNPRPAGNAIGGGRFDATVEDPFPFLYAANDEATAISEVLLRDIPVDAGGARLLPKARIKGLQISWLRIETDLELVSIRSGADLAAVGQDSWLTATTSEYDSTCQWCAAIRAWAPRACGMTWRSLREPDGFAFIFLVTAAPKGVSRNTRSICPPADDRELESGPAHQYLRLILARYLVAIM